MQKNCELPENEASSLSVIGRFLIRSSPDDAFIQVATLQSGASSERRRSPNNPVNNTRTDLFLFLFAASFAAIREEKRCRRERDEDKDGGGFRPRRGLRQGLPGVQREVGRRKTSWARANEVLVDDFGHNLGHVMNSLRLLQPLPHLLVLPPQRPMGDKKRKC